MDFIKRIVNFGFNRLVKFLIIVIKPTTRYTAIFR